MHQRHTSKLPKIFKLCIYFFCEFRTFPVTEGNEIRHIHFSLKTPDRKLTQTHPKIHKKYELPAFPHPESNEFQKPLIHS